MNTSPSSSDFTSYTWASTTPLAAGQTASAPAPTPAPVTPSYVSVNSTVTYTLSANLEALTLGGASLINGTGNDLNNTLSGIETVFFLTNQEFAAINATIVREIYNNKGAISAFVSNSHLLEA
jgi:hypothetical protein